MNRKERFEKAFNYVRVKGLIRTQKDLAEKMGSTPPNVSSALKGVETALTDNFIFRFVKLFPDISLQWLLNGEGNMLTAKPNFLIDDGMHYSIPKSESEIKDDLIEMLKTTNDLKDETIDSLKREIAAKDETIRAQRETIEALKNSKKPPKRWGDSGMVADDNLPLK